MQLRNVFWIINPNLWTCVQYKGATSQYNPRLWILYKTTSSDSEHYSSRLDFLPTRGVPLLRQMVLAWWETAQWDKVEGQTRPAGDSDEEQSSVSTLLCTHNPFFCVLVACGFPKSTSRSLGREQHRVLQQPQLLQAWSEADRVRDRENIDPCTHLASRGNPMTRKKSI